MSSLDIICPCIERDTDRFIILWKSLQKFLQIKDYRIFLVSPSGFSPISSPHLIPIKEMELDPSLINKEYINDGWWKQQVVKLLSHKLCSSEHILSLDADCFLNKPMSLKDIVNKNRSKLTVSEGGSWDNWYRGSKYILKLPYKIDKNKKVGVTPFIFSRTILKGLYKYLSIISKDKVVQYLLDNTSLNSLSKGDTWSEYCLYHVYADYTGMIDKYHDVDSNFQLYGNCFWNETEADNWDPKQSFDQPDHYFTVAQSIAKKSPEWVYNQVKEYLE